MSAARAWLPPGTCHARVDQRIAEAMRDWSRDWMGDEIIVARPEGVQAPRPSSSGTLHPLAPGAWLVAPANLVPLLGQLALRVGGSGEVADADQPIVESVGSEALEDLQSRLVRELGLTSSGQSGAPAPDATIAQRWTIERRGSPLRFELVVSEAWRTELALALMPAPSASMPLDSAATAIASVEVELGASIGRCALTVAELRSLSPGDVLLFDRPLDAALPLAIDGAPTARGTGAVAREADRLLLHIVEPLYGKIA